ncbi:MAG: hypothetical protein NUK63_05480 [Candidatus Bathyarchaeum tardum]|nr:MAG: hypothetical protein NUK63_05480 [Candidatus Bathyarchaeum tardum]
MVCFKHLTKSALVYYQKFGHFDEHLASLYSLAYGKPYIYKDTYLAYFDNYSKLLHLSLFELNAKENDFSCIEEAVKMFKPEKLVITAPHELPMDLGKFKCIDINQDTDYQIYVPDFDLTLKGSHLSDARYRVRNAEKRGYTLKISKKMTPAHFHIIAQHEHSKRLDLYDRQLYFAIYDYLRNFKTPVLFDVVCDGTLLGFDLIDFLSDTMTVPLGFYTDAPSISDFIMFNEINYAKQKGFSWLDLGWACNLGIEEFKKKWTAIPRFKIWGYEYVINKAVSDLTKKIVEHQLT